MQRSRRAWNPECISAAAERARAAAAAPGAVEPPEGEEVVYPLDPALRRFVADVMLIRDGAYFFPYSPERLRRLRAFTASPAGDFDVLAKARKVACPVLVFRGGHFTSFGLGEFGPVAGRYAVGAIGDITLVISYRQRDRFGRSEFRMVTGIVAVPAVRNVAGESHVSRFRLAQSRVIAGCAAILAVRQVLGGIGALRK